MMMAEVSPGDTDRTMTKLPSVAEAAAVYGMAVADLQHPIILQQEGRPLAVIIAFEEYQRLRALAIDEARRRQAGWQALEALLQDVHRRPSDLVSEQIEAEIGLARVEAKQTRHVS
jgi:PHD/YefM family antitoxin component YafN of YafNO toxin-antitoxin module